MKGGRKVQSFNSETWSCLWNSSRCYANAKRMELEMEQANEIPETKHAELNV